MAGYARHAGSWKPYKGVWQREGGTWKVVSEIYTPHEGVYTLVYKAEAIAVVAANVNNLNLSTLFSAEDWTSPSKTKRVIINPGVVVGSTSPSTAALLTGAGWGSSLTIEILGSVHGAGGAANSGAGGPAIHCQAVGAIFEIGVLGAVRGGGGGGGRGGNGGTGGGGYYNQAYTAREPASGQHYTTSYRVTGNKKPDQYADYRWFWAGNTIYTGATQSFTSGSITYYRGTLMSGDTSGTVWSATWGIYRTYPSSYQVNTNGGAGGAGGNGGRGEGSNHARASGSGGAAGANGGTNAGKGGTGGTGGAGGTWAAAGAKGNTGATGASGNRTGGSGGAAGANGGAAGAAIIGSSRTLINNGTIAGAT